MKPLSLLYAKQHAISSSLRGQCPCPAAHHSSRHPHTHTEIGMALTMCKEKGRYLLVLTMSSRARALTGEGSSGRNSTVLSKGSPGTICTPQNLALHFWFPVHARQRSFFHKDQTCTEAVGRC